MAVRSQPRQIVRETLSQKHPSQKGLAEWLKVKVLSSNSVLQKNKTMQLMGLSDTGQLHGEETLELYHCQLTKLPVLIYCTMSSKASASWLPLQPALKSSMGIMIHTPQERLQPQPTLPCTAWAILCFLQEHSVWRSPEEFSFTPLSPHPQYPICHQILSILPTKYIHNLCSSYVYHITLFQGILISPF
jgi:hypothetical protein